jgi:hypothetical protein
MALTVLSRLACQKEHSVPSGFFPAKDVPTGQLNNRSMKSLTCLGFQ